MKIKILLISVLLILSVFAAGCLSSDVHYNSHWRTAEFHSDHPETVPAGEDIHRFTTYSPNVTVNYAYNTGKLLEEQSVLIVYVTVEDIRPSEWNTSDGKIPPVVQEQLDENVPLHSPVHSIYTDMIVTVQEWAKGDCPEEITVKVVGGQVDNVIQYEDIFPSPWDFEVGGQYLLYLSKYRGLCEGPYELTQGDSVQVVIMSP